MDGSRFVSLKYLKEKYDSMNHDMQILLGEYDGKAEQCANLEDVDRVKDNIRDKALAVINELFN
jgi:hypothetical protein